MATSRSQRLIITAAAYDAMIAHCVKGSALACCGILAGFPPTASVAYPLRDDANSQVRYQADVRDLYRVHVDLRKRGLAVVAIYHFRPRTAAIPSRTDLRENNYADLPRGIVALGERPTVRAWRLARRYCEELTWHLESRDASPTADGDGLCAEEGMVGARPPASFLRRLLWWRRLPTRIPIGCLPDHAPLEPEPMWDPALDRADMRE